MMRRSSIVFLVIVLLAPHPMALRDIMADVAMYLVTVLQVKGVLVDTIYCARYRYSIA